MSANENVGPKAITAPRTCRNSNHGNNHCMLGTSHVLPPAADDSIWQAPRFGRLGDLLRAARDEVDEDVLAEVLGRGIEGATAVEPGHEGDELRQCPRALEHERVDRDPFLRAALHFA